MYQKKLMEQNFWDLSHVIKDDGLLTDIQTGEAIGSIVDYIYHMQKFSECLKSLVLS